MYALFKLYGVMVNMFIKLFPVSSGELWCFLGYCGGNHKSHITRASKTLTGPFDATTTDLEYISGETCSYFKQTYEH